LLPKAIYTFNAVHVKIPMTSCAELVILILKYIWKLKIPQTSKANLNKKPNAEDITIPNFKLYYR
jgi:hypothetical protein